jgi:predicted RNA-binding Zn-ribbon protein involved in translation (DUF1610 family)
MPQRELDPSQIGEDWEGNNIAITCPACGKVFIVSGLIHRGQRACPKCGKSTGVLKGGRKTGGTAFIKW